MKMQPSQVHRDRKENRGYQGLEGKEKGTYSLIGTGFMSGMKRFSVQIVVIATQYCECV